MEGADPRDTLIEAKKMKGFKIRRKDFYVVMAVLSLSMAVGSFYVNSRESEWKRKWMDLAGQLARMREDWSMLEEEYDVKNMFYVDLTAPSCEVLFRYSISPERTPAQFRDLCEKYDVSSVDVCSSKEWGRFLLFAIGGQLYCVTRDGRLFGYKNDRFMKKHIDFTEEQNLYGGHQNAMDDIFSTWNEAGRH